MTPRYKALTLVYGFVLFTGLASAQPLTVRIMPLGDSITYGSPVAGGYRAPLYHMLTNAAYAVDYVGTATGNASADLPEVNHEGHGGWRISDPSVGLYENIFGWFEAIEDPHVVLLHIGTNDSGGGTLFTNAVDRLDALVTRIARCQPSAHIIVTTLMKRGEPNYTAITNWFNPFVPGKVAAQQALGRRVHFLDMHAYLELSDMGDNLHPNAGGYHKMANAWFPAITNIIGTSPAPNQPAPIRALGTTANRTAATLTFNKPLSPDSATNTANYAVDQGLTVTAVTLGANLRTVTLVTSLQAPQTAYTVTLNNILDQTEPAALTIPANSQVTFTSPAPPALLRASGRSNRTQIDLVFSKPMSPDSATNTAHYALSGGLTVDSATISGDRLTVTLLTSEQTEGAPYTVTASDIDDDSTPSPLTIPAGSQVTFNAYKPPMPRGYWNYVPESAAYAPVYKLDLATQPNYTATIPYAFDNSAEVGGFDRVAYYLELQQQPGDDLQYVWVSMDAFTNRADKLGIPNLASGAVYQRFVHNLHVVCNVPGVATGDVPSGNIEFWPYNYSGGNALGIPGADTVAYDFGDACSFSANYSCMQVHNYSAGQTVFALNHWSSGSTIEVGIGNQPTGHPDWTFSNNGGTFTVKTLYVLVRRDASDTTPPTPVSAQADFSRQLVTVSFSEPLAPSSADPRLFALDHGVATLGATLEADRRTVRLLTSRQPAGTALTLTITGVRDASPNANAVAPGTTLPVDAPALPAEIVTHVGTNAGDFASGYECVYTLDIPVTGSFNATANPYRVNRTLTVPVIDAFDRIAYYIELVKMDGTTQYLWASMDAFTTDRAKIAVPTLASGASFQRSVANLDVKSNVDGIINGSGMTGGNLEFWPNNYGTTNAAAVPGASNDTYDFGDRPEPGGHGSMQLHNSAAAQTLFAMNNWGGDGNTLALGIGNRPTSSPDWTFANNAGTDYTRRTLHVLVRPAAAPPLPPPVAANVPSAQGYRHVYTFDLPIYGSFFTSAPAYTVFADTNNLPPYSRVAYYLELQAGTAPTQWIWTAMDAFTADPSKIGLPATNCFFQTRVTRLDVRSNVDGIINGTDMDTGNIEFWPSNYGQGNSIGIPNASGSMFDFGDGGANGSQNGHGSMQVHNYGAGATQTLLAVNNFNNNKQLCIGIGNCPTFAANGYDWTFASNAGSYNHRRLHVFVLCAGSAADLTRPTLLNATGSLALNQIALGFSEPLADSSATPEFFTVAPDVTVLDAWLGPNKKDVLLRTSPLAAGQLYTVSVTGVRDRSFNGNPVAPATSLSFRAPVSCPAGPLAGIPESGDYDLVSYLAVSNTVNYVNGANYLVDESRFQQIQPFDRVAYCVNLIDTNGVQKWVWVSMDAYTNDLSMIGVPTADRGARLQQVVSNLTVHASANVAGISVSTGTGIPAGNIEFWPNNYGTGNTQGIPGASGSNYDWGDSIDTVTTVGHGSMQVHKFAQGQTIFSMISFGSNGRTPGLGIGNKPGTGTDPDWTFTYNAREFATKDIYILARRGVPTTPTGMRPDIWNQPRSAKIRAGGTVMFSIYSPNATAFQWRHNGEVIPGATASWLQLDDAGNDAAGSYDVVVYGTGSQAILSQSATLTVIQGGAVMRLK